MSLGPHRGTTKRRATHLHTDIRYGRQRHAAEFNFWDLGEQWNKVVGLPFVYALWLIRPEVRDFKSVANRLRALRDENLANLDQLIAEVVAPRSSRRQDRLRVQAVGADAERVEKGVRRYFRGQSRLLRPEVAALVAPAV